VPTSVAFEAVEAVDADTGAVKWVIIDRDGDLHREASTWLDWLWSVRAPLTVRAYGSRVAQFLSWCAGVVDWRDVKVAHLAMWRNVVSRSPFAGANGQPALRAGGTVAGYMVAARSFLEWADSHGLLATDVVSRMTQEKYFAPGTPGGGEHGARRRVLADVLRTPRVEPGAAQWIADPRARDALALLELPARDRFLIDLLSSSGIRVGEALSLFTDDLHFGGGAAVGCPNVDAHFHVRVGNPVENGAYAKGGPRVLHAHPDLVDSYVDYVLERRGVLGDADRSAHVFVNLYTVPAHLGAALSYTSVRRVLARCSRRIGFTISGPHMLRHTFATRLVRGIDCEPVSLEVVQVLLGHASLSSTRRYTHGAEAAGKAATQHLSPRTLSVPAPG
jgi:integrase/recombinase XerD